MKKLKNSLPVLLILTLIITAIATLSPVTSGSTTNYSVDPSAVVGTWYTPGTMFDVNVTVTGATDLFGYEFKLVYDTGILTATSITLGPVFPQAVGSPPHGPTIIWKKEIDDTLGYAWYAVSLGDYAPTYPSGINVPGTGVLATVSFTVDADGYGGSILDLADTVLSDSGGAGIAHIVYDGVFSNVRDPPTAVLTASTTTPELTDKIFFDASGSYASVPEGWIASYEWDFGDGSPKQTTTDPDNDWDYDMLGTFTVTLVVTDDLGAKGKTQVTIMVYPPSAAIADLSDWKARPAHKNHDISKYGTVNTFYAIVMNLGNSSSTVTVKVQFTVFDKDGNQVGSPFETNEYTFPAYTYLRTTDYWLLGTEYHGLNTTATGEFDVTGLTGVFYATALCYYKVGSGSYIAGTATKTFAFRVKP